MPEINTLALKTDGNIKAYYRAETGALTTDSSGNSKTLTNNNTVAEGVGKYGVGADTGDGTGSKSLTIADNLGIAGNSDASISIQIKLNAEITSGTWYIFSHGSTTTLDRFWQLRYEYNGGTLRLNAYMSGQANYYNIALGTTSFIHIVLVRDVANAKSILYINGANVAEGTLGSTAGTVNGFGLFADVDGSQSGLAAILDDVALFNRVLTPAEVSQIYNEGQGFFLLI